MVLKRLLVTALGALGLGALAAGTASGQQTAGSGNIPAPDIFDDQITVLHARAVGNTDADRQLPQNAAAMDAMTRWTH